MDGGGLQGKSFMEKVAFQLSFEGFGKIVTIGGTSREVILASGIQWSRSTKKAYV